MANIVDENVTKPIAGQTPWSQDRARLVSAAKEIFERDGFLEARITDISKRAGLSHGAYYHYFDSKEAAVPRGCRDPGGAAHCASRGSRAQRSRGDSAMERIRKANRRYLLRYREEARIMGVIEQVSRYDAPVNEVRMARQKHFAERSERAIRRWQQEGIADPGIDAALAADALGAMVGRFAELWLVQGYRAYDFDHAVEQLTRIWANALRLEDEASG